MNNVILKSYKSQNIAIVTNHKSLKLALAKMQEKRNQGIKNFKIITNKKLYNNG